MKFVRSICIAVLAVIAIAVVLRMLVVKIAPGQTGVVNAEWTVGLVERDYGPGYHWDIGPLHTWNVFDTTVQTLHMARNREEPDHGDVAGPFQVKSNDGATVTLDVTLKYQIEPGKTWLVLKEFGAGDRYKEKVRNEAIDIMRAALGKLVTEQFYDPTRRREISGQMESAITARLALMHTRLIGLLIRDLEFEEAFEARIKEKTLAQQDVELNIAQTKAADYRGRTNRILAETDAKVAVIHEQKEKTLATMRAENDKAIAQIRANWRKVAAAVSSDADLYAALQEAEGTRLRREAEARGQSLRREALGSTGGENLVALELARNLRLGALSVSTQLVNPLDIDAMMRLLGMKADLAAPPRPEQN